MDYYFDRALSKLTHPMTEVQYWCLLQYVTAKIGSGHTNVLLSEATLNKFDSQPHYMLPFDVYFDNNKMCIKDFNSKRDTALRLGDEIVSIDGETKHELYNHIRTLVSGDGISKSYKNYQLETGGFNRIYALIHPVKQEFNVIIKTAKGTEKALLLKAKSVSYNHVTTKDGKADNSLNDVHYSGNLNNNLPDSSLHRVFYPKDNPWAVLKIQSFIYSDYLSFHKKIFKDFREKHITDLIIDIRNNPGGHDYICIDLLKYLINDNFYFTKKDEGMVHPEEFKTLLGQKKGTIDLSLIDSKLYTIQYPANELQKPYKNIFSGHIHLLVNGGTFSAASLFAVALKTQGNCIVHGYETGGGKAGCDGGSIVKITLPQTSLQLNLPLLWTYSASKDTNTGRGLIPDDQFKPFFFDLDYFWLTYYIKQNDNVNQK